MGACGGLGQQKLHENPVFQTIKQLQQRLAELKRTLQKELVSPRQPPPSPPPGLLGERHLLSSSWCSTEAESRPRP